MNGLTNLLGKLFSQEITLMFTSVFSDLPDDSQPQETRRAWSPLNFSATYSDTESPMIPEEDLTLYVPFWNLKKFYEHLEALGIRSDDNIPFAKRVSYSCDAYTSAILMEKVIDLTC